MNLVLESGLISIRKINELDDEGLIDLLAE